MENCPPKTSLETLLAQGGGGVDPQTGAVIPSVHPSTTFERSADGEYPLGYAYARDQNPTYDRVEALLARLESGTGALLFSSGMAAAAAVFQTVLRPGDHAVVPRVMYWGLRSWIASFADHFGIDIDIVDDLAAAVVPDRTKLVWIETPANPLWSITDIAAVARTAHAAGAIVAVDSTVATPILTRPLELEADIVMHSATKYLNGHSDVVGGALVTKDDKLHDRLRAARVGGGAILGPFEAWLLLRGMRTLAVRVRHVCATTSTIARHLDAHDGVTEVLYPGLVSHPDHDLAAVQMDGEFGAMLSFRTGGGVDRAMAVAARLEIIHRATSLGGVESLVEHRASIEGPGSPVPDDLLRLSVGLENPSDLIADLDHALALTRVGPC